jgi:hypothetical protein
LAAASSVDGRQQAIERLAKERDAVFEELIGYLG